MSAKLANTLSYLLHETRKILFQEKKLVSGRLVSRLAIPCNVN